MRNEIPQRLVQHILKIQLEIQYAMVATAQVCLDGDEEISPVCRIRLQRTMTHLERINIRVKIMELVFESTFIWN
jgi:hypothetical protein